MNLKKIDIKNSTCHYFNDITKIKDIDFDILFDKKSYKYILIYDISHKTFMGVKPLPIK